jgi:hypothetical protein
MELITMLGGGIFGAFLKLWQQAATARNERMLASMKIDRLNAKLINQARQYNDKGFSWTRRLIALSCVFIIIIFPKLLAAFMPETAIWISSEALDPGFLFFKEEKTYTEWQRLNGLVITPLDTNIVSAVIGMYFGASIAKK